ncbi:MAG TPA: cobalamin-binding protein [Candidatus Binatia bacterium]|jgi:iron complex transport system substrate-binding protein|nr:cobalamin-binding protein [Candidatus Binatia bacterium]
MKTPERIISLLPSSTEILCALGLRDRLVGVSHECDFPADVIGLPVLTEPKLNPHGPSTAIDARVRAIVQEGLSVYRINTEVLQQLQPNLIVTQDQCEVCAVSLPEVEEAARCFLTPGVQIVSLKPQRLGDVWQDIHRVGQATGQETAAEEVVRGLKRRLWTLEQKTRHARRPRVACIEWLAPLMAGGNWVPELVEIAGGEYSFAAAGTHSPKITWQTLVEYQPEVIVIMPCGFKIPQTQADLPTLTRHPHWHELPAVQANRVYVVDGNAYFNRPGPRIVESAEILAEILHSQECIGTAPARAYVRV